MAAEVSWGHAAGTRILLVAGRPSHGPGAHEFNAGCLLLKKCLEGVAGVQPSVCREWPTDPAAFEGVAAIVIYSDGDGAHPALAGKRLEQLAKAVKAGTGLALLHYAVEPALAHGEKEFLDWVGGCFELNWSVNPTWTPEFKTLPDHPVARGVKPFTLEDEWYFHMRFREKIEGITPVLSAVFPRGTRPLPDGIRSGNPAVRESVERGEAQCLAWVFERADGGRSFAFTGGHPHTNWGNGNFRKLVLNGILWIAKVDVPNNGVQSQVTPEELKQNLDVKPPPKARKSK